jgi:hypothetical protein
VLSLAERAASVLVSPRSDARCAAGRSTGQGGTDSDAGSAERDLVRTGPSSVSAPSGRSAGQCRRAGLGRWAHEARVGGDADRHVAGAGKFRPGQPLGTGNEIGTIRDSWYQADLFGFGLDGTPWKFWEYNDGPWMHGAIRSEGLTQAGAPLAVRSGYVVGESDPVVRLCAAAITGNGLAVFDQKQDGRWNPILVRTDQPLPASAHLTQLIPSVSALAVDGSGTLRFFHQNDHPANTTLALTSTALSGPKFAPPGAPITFDSRLRGGLSPQAGQFDDLNVFVVDNDGQLWVFDLPSDSTDLYTGWTGAPMPNPNGVRLPAGANLATGYQVLEQQVGAEQNSLGYSQLDVFAIDIDGNLQVWWESQGADWHQQPMPDGSGLPPGAPIATGLQVYELPAQTTPIGNQLDVFVAGYDGRIARWWVYRSGTWNHDLLPAAHPVPPGANIATAHPHVDSDKLIQQLDVFAVGVDGRIVVFWQTQGFDWATEIMPGSDDANVPTPM